MDIRFDDKTAIITGGASGIGLGIASELAASGASVILFDINDEAAAEACRQIAAAGGNATASHVDVTDIASVRAAIEDAVSRAGGVDIVVTSAGTAARHELLGHGDPDMWRTIVNINLYGTVNICDAIIPYLVDRGGGRIITIASDAARIGSAGEAVYSATKGGVMALTRSLARELARYNITVNCVSPGPTDTPMLRRWAAGQEAVLEKIVRGVPLRRLGTPEDIAASVAFLASEHAAFITGQVLSVSGGVTMA